jgi:hypothetical protein
MFKPIMIIYTDHMFHIVTGLFHVSPLQGSIGPVVLSVCFIKGIETWNDQKQHIHIFIVFVCLFQNYLLYSLLYVWIECELKSTHWIPHGLLQSNSSRTRIVDARLHNINIHHVLWVYSGGCFVSYISRLFQAFLRFQMNHIFVLLQMWWNFVVMVGLVLSTLSTYCSM